MTTHTANLAPIPILTYHQIAAAPPKGSPYRSLYVHPQSFARQMAFLSLLGYRGLSMDGLLPYLRGERVGKVVGITFDDGYLNNLDNALPVLKKYSFSSTCYVVSQQIAKTNSWDREVGIPEVPLMSTQQLQQWVAGGQTLGAHTRNHVHLPQLDAAACHEEIAGCKAELEQIVGSSIGHFCYPYGDYAAEHMAMVQDTGYATATTTQRARVRLGDGLCQLPRVPVLRSTTLPVFWVKLATAYEDRRRA